jgi:hypothetical protein
MACQTHSDRAVKWHFTLFTKTSAIGFIFFIFHFFAEIARTLRSNLILNLSRFFKILFPEA